FADKYLTGCRAARPPGPGGSRPGVRRARLRAALGLHALPQLGQAEARAELSPLLRLAPGGLQEFLKSQYRSLAQVLLLFIRETDRREEPSRCPTQDKPREQAFLAVAAAADPAAAQSGVLIASCCAAAAPRPVPAAHETSRPAECPLIYTHSWAQHCVHQISFFCVGQACDPVQNPATDVHFAPSAKIENELLRTNRYCAFSVDLHLSPSHGVSDLLQTGSSCLEDILQDRKMPNTG
ncbi:unnamed protein product, partial [Rangifer tarandus platyrhynchus]